MLSKVIGRHICSCFPEGESIKDPVRWQPMNFIVQNRQEYKVLFGYFIPLDGLKWSKDHIFTYSALIGLYTDQMKSHVLASFTQ